MAQFNVPPPLILTGNLSENWKRFKKNFNIYMSATDYVKEKDERQVAILLNIIGPEALDLFDTFNLGDAEKKIAKVLEAFEAYCNPKKNILHSRFLFYSRKQREGESFDSFLLDCKTLVQNCEFKDETELLRDKIVLDSCDIETMDAIIKMGDISLADASGKFRVAELLRRQTKEMHMSTSVDVVKESPRIKEYQKYDRGQRGGMQGDIPSTSTPTPTNSMKLIKCNKCGYQHTVSKCPASGKICHKCKKPNHFSSVCKSKIQLIAHDSDGEMQENNGYFCNQLQVHNSRGWMEKIKVENLFVNFRLDTGADANVLPETIFRQIVAKSDKFIKLFKHVSLLKAYNESSIKTLGQVFLNINIRNIDVVIKFVVVAGDLSPILGIETCEKLGLISRNSVNGIQLKLCKERIIDNFSDVFEGIGCFPGTVSIKVKDGTVPTSKPPSRVPLKLQERLKVELNRLCKEGIISKVEGPSEWVHKLVIIEKSNGSLRICLDPRDLNNCIVRQYFSMPTIQDLSSRVGSAKYFCVLDLKDSFWHVLLDDKSSGYCTFGTIFGTYRFHRLPFGLNISAEVFSQANYKVFGDIKNVFIYVDDLLIFGESEQEMNEALLTVLERARQFNIKFNLSKFKYNVTSVKYLGQIIENGTMKPDESRIEAILNYTAPKDKKDLQRFLGLINYLRDYIENLAELSQPLRDLLKKSNEFVWLESHHACFTKLKNSLVNAPVLQNFDRNKEIVIQTDSSKDSIGCVLLQEGRPVCYASKSLSDTEQRYAQIEKEFLAVLFSCKKFHQYVYGTKIVIQTDHLPLLTIIKKDINSIPSRRLQCIKLKLSMYDFDLQFISGKKMLIADAISRACVKSDHTDSVDLDVDDVIHTINISSEIQDKFKDETNKDLILSKVLQSVRNKWDKNKKEISDDMKFFYNVRDQLSVSNGLLFFGERVVVPNSLKEFILDKLHEAHIGITKTKGRAKNLFYWQGMNKDIENYVLRCSVCEKYRPQNSKEPMITQKCPEYPFKKISCDILEYGGSSYLVVMDYFSRWLELVKISSKNSDTVIKVLKTIFSIHGIPEVMIADNMPFGSRELSNFSVVWNFKIVTSSPRYPRSNGLAEKGVDIAKRMLKKSRESNTEIELMLLEYRCMPVLGSDYSPSQLLMSRMLRTKLPVFKDKIFKPKVQKGFNEFSNNRSYKVKEYYDNKCKKAKYFDAGENVTYWNERLKLWQPAVVIDKHSTPRSYWIRDEYNRVKRRNSFHLRKSFNTIGKPNVKGQDTNLTYNSNNYNNLPKIEKWYDKCGNGNYDGDSKNMIVCNEDDKARNDLCTQDNTQRSTNTTRSGRIVKKPVRFDL